LAAVLQKMAFPGIGVGQPHLSRCVVERFLAWIGGNRCLSKDSKTTIAAANAFFKEASGILLLCLTCRRA